MPKVAVKNVGAVGVVRDLSVHELPPEAWTDALNVRFLDGYAYQFLGHGEVYSAPTLVPQFVMPVNVAGARYWLYATATRVFAVSNTGGTTVHTDITHLTPRAGLVNAWSGFVFGGIPILNVDGSGVPMYWDQNLTHKFVDLPAWPSTMRAKVVRQFKNFMIALNVTKGATNYPFMLKWSSPAVPGAVPTTWNEADATNDAGEFDIGEGQDPIIDGLGLKNSFIVYKESSTYAVDYIGGQFVFSSRKVFGMSGALNINCAVEFDAFHFVVTGSDVVIHDGYNATSVLDKRARRAFFQDIDTTGKGLVFCYKNPFLNEIFVAYPSIGATTCNRAMVYNFVDKTVSYRTLPNLNHANYGSVDNSLGANWNQVNDPWDAFLRAWNGPDFTPDTARVLMASADVKLYMLDASASFGGAAPSSFMERRGLSFGEPERIKLVTGIRPRVTGNAGQTVTIKIGAQADPYAEPVYTTMNFTIGADVKCDCFVSGRYIAVWIGSGSAYTWRLDSYDLFVENGGEY